jgi:hypothetical protein
LRRAIGVLRVRRGHKQEGRRKGKDAKRGWNFTWEFVWHGHSPTK